MIRQKKWFRTIYLKYLVTQAEITASRAPEVVTKQSRRELGDKSLVNYSKSEEYFNDCNYIAHIIQQYNNSLSEPHYQDNDMKFIKIHKYHTVSTLSGFTKPYDDTQIKQFEQNISENKRTLEYEFTRLKDRTASGVKEHRQKLIQLTLRMITKYEKEQEKLLQGNKGENYTTQIKSYLINNVLENLSDIQSLLDREQQGETFEEVLKQDLAKLQKQQEEAKALSERLESNETVLLIRQADEAKATANKLLTRVNAMMSRVLKGGKSRRKKSRKTKSRKRKVMKRRR